MMNLFPGCCLPVLYYEPITSNTLNSTTSHSSISSSTTSTTQSITSIYHPTVRPMRWGLVPSYHNPNEKPDFFYMFNARSETITEKSVFKNLINKQRCIIFVDGYYEWIPLSTPTTSTNITSSPSKSEIKKIPVYVRRNDGLPLLLAGLYSKCTINRSITGLHHSSSQGTKISSNTSDDNDGNDDNISTAKYNYTEYIDDNNSTIKTISSIPTNSSVSSIHPLLHNKTELYNYPIKTSLPSVTEAINMKPTLYPLIPDKEKYIQINSVSSSSITGSPISKKRKREDHDHEQEGLQDNNNSVMYSCTILTSEPSKELAWLHNRMPVILDENTARQWLNIEMDYNTLVTMNNNISLSSNTNIIRIPVDSSSSITTSTPHHYPFLTPLLPNIGWHICHPRMNSVKYQEKNITELYLPQQLNELLDSFKTKSIANNSNNNNKGIQKNMMDFFTKSPIKNTSHGDMSSSSLSSRSSTSFGSSSSLPAISNNTNSKSIHHDPEIVDLCNDSEDENDVIDLSHLDDAKGYDDEIND